MPPPAFPAAAKCRLAASPMSPPFDSWRCRTGQSLRHVTVPAGSWQALWRSRWERQGSGAGTAGCPAAAGAWLPCCPCCCRPCCTLLVPRPHTTSPASPQPTPLLYCSVLFNFLGRDFFNALSAKDQEKFAEMLVKWLAALFLGIPVFVLR